MTFKYVGNKEWSDSGVVIGYTDRVVLVTWGIIYERCNELMQV